MTDQQVKSDQGSSEAKLDGATFEVIVHRLRPSAPGGEWLVRVYQGVEHIHSAEGGVTLNTGLREADQAMRRWLDENGAR